MSKRVVFLCETMQNAVFFLHMEKALAEINYEVIYVCIDFSVYKRLKKMTNNTVILVKKHEYPCDVQLIFYGKDFIEKQISEKNAEVLFQSLTAVCTNINKAKRIDLILATQAVTVAELAIKQFANNNDIAVLFYELANIPGKTFWDIDGSNARSYLYKHIDLLDSYQIDDSDYELWREKYIADNLKTHIVKQAISIKSFNYYYGILSRLSFLMTGYKQRHFDFKAKLKQWLNSRKLCVEFDQYNIQTGHYIFFPMQVASDSQIILNSDIGLLEAVKHSLAEAKKNNMDLVIKLHPAERDAGIILRLLELRAKYHFKIVNYNTFEVIRYAERVITINSTVALEAMILEKPVSILGRSYYKFFNKERVKKYIMGYLVNMDPFSTRDFTTEQIGEMLRRIKRKV